MSTIAEVRAKYANHHSELASAFYKKKRSEEGVTPQEQIDFDTAHAQLWADCAAEIKTASDYVEPALPKIVVQVNQLLEWKANLLVWLHEQVGDPPTE